MTNLKLHVPMLKTTMASVLAITALTFSSCQDEDYGFTTEDVRASVYARNFENMYGKIDKDQIWDFSSYNLNRLGLDGGPSAISTRAGGSSAAYTGSVPNYLQQTTASTSNILSSNTPYPGITLTSDGWYAVDDNTIDWLNTNLRESDPGNVDKGYPFVFSKPEKNLAIIPIYQGHSGLSWEFHMVDNGANKDYVLWQKSKDIRYTENYQYEFSYNGKKIKRGEEIDYLTLYKDEGGDVEEYFPHNNDNDPWVPKVLKIGKAFQNVGDYANDGVGVEVTFKVPKGKKLTGYFTANDGIQFHSNFNGTGKVNCDNTSGTKDEYFTFELTSGAKYYKNNENKTVRWSDLCFVVTNDYQFDTYSTDEEHIRIYAYYKKDYDNVRNLNYGTSYNHHTIDKHNVESKPIYIDASKLYGDVYFYLKITGTDKYLDAKSGECQRSDEGMMVALNINNKPNNISDGYEHMIIGCEDLYRGSDWDVNDIVFLVVGQKTLPQRKQVLVKKRYMIEDLGSTFDFDFNDIVVDVTRTVTYNYRGESLGQKDEATLKHLCGTIPFQITIGDTEFPVLLGNNNNDSPDGFDPSSDKTHYGSVMPIEVSGWNPSTNNIRVKVWPKNAGLTWNQVGSPSGATWDDQNGSNYLGLYPEQSQTFGFPANGEYPYIIACDPSVNWMKELISVPPYWFKTWPQEYYDWNNQGSSDSGTTGGGTTTDISVPTWAASIGQYSPTNNEVFLHSFINNYNNINKINVIVTNPSSQTITAYVTGGDASTSEVSIEPGTYKNIEVTNARTKVSEYIRLVFSVNINSLSQEARPKIYLGYDKNNQTGYLTSQQVFGTDSWWTNSSTNGGKMFDGKIDQIKTLSQYYTKLRVYYTLTSGQCYGFYQANGNNNWYNDRLSVDGDIKQDYIEIELSKFVNNTNPLYIHISDNKGGFSVTDVQLIP